MQFWIWSSCNLPGGILLNINNLPLKKRLCNPHWTYLFIGYNFFLHLLSGHAICRWIMSFVLVKKGIEFYFYFIDLNYILIMWNSHITTKHKHLIPHTLHLYIITRPRQFQIYTTESTSWQMNLMYHSMEISNNYVKMLI